MDTRDLFDYEVREMNGRRIGEVTGVWADDATGEPEFVGVKPGWLFGRTHLVPLRDARIDASARQIVVPSEERRIKEAPAFADTERLSPQEEAEVYRFYGLERGLARSPTGLPEERGMRAEGELGRERGVGELERGEAVDVPLHEEEMHVGKREVETGGIRLRKVVRTETAQEPVELRRESIEIERIPPEQIGRGAEVREASEELEMRTRAEEPVVQKEDHIVGAMRARKTAETERRTVEGELRREDVEVDRDLERRRREGEL